MPDKTTLVPLPHHGQAFILRELKSDTIINYRNQLIAILFNRSMLPCLGDICNTVDELSRLVIDKRYHDIAITIYITVFAILFRTYTDTCSSITKIRSIIIYIWDNYSFFSIHIPPFPIHATAGSAFMQVRVSIVRPRKPNDKDSQYDERDQRD